MNTTNRLTVAEAIQKIQSKSFMYADEMYQAMDVLLNSYNNLKKKNLNLEDELLDITDRYEKKVYGCKYYQRKNKELRRKCAKLEERIEESEQSSVVVDAECVPYAEILSVQSMSSSDSESEITEAELASDITEFADFDNEQLLTPTIAEHTQYFDSVDVEHLSDGSCNIIGDENEVYGNIPSDLFREEYQEFFANNDEYDIFTFLEGDTTLRVVNRNFIPPASTWTEETNVRILKVTNNETEWDFDFRYYPLSNQLRRFSW